MAFETISIQNESGSQAIRIPESHKIHDDKVYVKRLGNVLYLIPYHNPWQNLLKALTNLRLISWKKGESPQNKKGRRSTNGVPS